MAVRDSRNVTGAEKLARRIKTIRASLAIGPMVNEIGDLLLRRTLKRFDEETAPDGTKWKPLKPETQRRRAWLGVMSPRMLVNTGNLRSSITIIRGNATEALYANTGAGVRIGIEGGTEEAEYGRHINYGTRKMRARRFLGIGPLDIKAVDAFLRRQV